MRLNKLIPFVLAFLFAACAPPIEPTAQPVATSQPDGVTIYNANPELAHGSCERDYFEDGFGKTYFWQCQPAGYELYEFSPIVERHEVTYTGVVYSIALGGRRGKIGYQLPATTIPATCAIIEVSGQIHAFPGLNNFSINANIAVNGGAGSVRLTPIAFPGNGDYIAKFYVDVGQVGTYDIRVYFSQIFQTTGTDAYTTIARIAVYPISAGHCTDAPGI